MPEYTEPTYVGGPTLNEALAAGARLDQLNRAQRAQNAASAAQARNALAAYRERENVRQQTVALQAAQMQNQAARLAEQSRLAGQRMGIGATLGAGRLAEAGLRRKSVEEQKEADRILKGAIAGATIEGRGERAETTDLRRETEAWEKKASDLAAGNVDWETFWRVVYGQAPPGADTQTYASLYALNMQERKRLYDAAQQTADGLNAILAKDLAQETESRKAKADLEGAASRHVAKFKKQPGVQFDYNNKVWRVNETDIKKPAFDFTPPPLQQAQRQAQAPAPAVGTPVPTPSAPVTPPVQTGWVVNPKTGKRELDIIPVK